MPLELELHRTVVVFQALLTGGLKEGKDLPASVKGPLEKELTGAVKTFSDYLKSER